MKTLFDMTISKKIFAACTLILAMFLAMLFLLILPAMERSLTQSLREGLTNNVDMAISLVGAYDARATAGEFSREEAQKRAMQEIGAIRYEGKNYLWINDTGAPYPTMLMHPIVPKLNGQVLDSQQYQCATSMQPGLDARNVEFPGGKKNLFQAFVDVTAKTGEGFVSYQWPKPTANGRPSAELYPKESYVKLYKPWGWIVGTGIYSDDVQKKISELRTTTALLSGLILVLAIAASLVISRSISKPIERIVAYAETVSGGNLDVVLEGKYSHEAGNLADNLRAMVARIKRRLAFAQGVLDGITVPCAVFSPDNAMVFSNQFMMTLIERDGKPEDYYGRSSGEFLFNDPSHDTISAKTLRENRFITLEQEVMAQRGSKRFVRMSSSPLAGSDGQSLGALTIWVDLTDIKAKEDRIEAQNARILHVATQAEEIAETLSSASEQLAAQVEEASRGAEAQKDQSAETATAMEQMDAAVLDVARNAQTAALRSVEAKEKAQSGQRAVGDVKTAMSGVHTRAMSLKERMALLEDRAKNIGRIMNVISEIADQTNLLALNAAIEAARAGDAGRGFAVVADEVRKLAEKTMNATQEVDDAITGIQRETTENIAMVEETAKAVEGAATLAENSEDVLGVIVSLSDGATGEVQAIATAAEQQSASSNEISRSVKHVNEVARETSITMNEAARAVVELSRQAHVLRDLINQCRTSQLHS